MDTQTDILDDIYRLDPSLREEDEAVRALVTDLLAKRPLVVPDQAFVARLRAELVGATVANPGLVRSPWYFYAAPVGVFALLLLMLVPRYVTSPTESVITPALDTGVTEVAPEGTDDRVRTFAPTVDGVDTPVGTSPSMKSAGGGVAETAPAAGSDMSLMALPVSEAETNLLIVATQRPGTKVDVESLYSTVPALVVIYRGADVIGVSEPVSPGIMTHATVLLAAPTKSEEELTAVLYADNDGNGIFTPGTDMMQTDGYGNAIQQTFLISASF